MTSEGKTARVTVTREKQFLSGWSSFKILTDDDERGSLHGGESLAVDLPPGDHRVAVQHREYTVYVDLTCEPGSQHALLTGFSVGVLSWVSGASAYASHASPVYLQEGG